MKQVERENALRNFKKSRLQILNDVRQVLASVQLIVGSTEVPSKIFLLFFLLPDWLKLNHLKSRMECGFQTFFRAIFVRP